MSRVCLDTSAYSHFKRGDASAVEAIRNARWIGVPSIVIGELRTGFLLGRRAEANEDELAEFLCEPVVNLLAVDEPATRHYADIVVALRRLGKPIPTNDIWIASLAAREGATVLTYDDHFTAVERVGVRILAAQ